MSASAAKTCRKSPTGGGVSNEFSNPATNFSLANFGQLHALRLIAAGLFVCLRKLLHLFTKIKAHEA